jgi:hypothetical protein
VQRLAACGQFLELGRWPLVVPDLPCARNLVVPCRVLLLPLLLCKGAAEGAHQCTCVVGRRAPRKITAKGFDPAVSAEKEEDGVCDALLSGLKLE